MKTKLIILIGATALVCAFPPLRANAAPDDEQNQRDRDAANFQGTPRLGELRRADRFIGVEIQNDAGYRMGKVKDLALDLQNGRITEVIVAAGGVLGIREKLVALPPESFNWDSEMKILRLKVDQAMLDRAPEFRMSHWVESTTAAPVAEVYQRYGVEPYFKGDTQLAPSMERAPQNGQDARYYHFNGENAAPHLGYVTRASHLMGTPAFNFQNEKLGRVRDFMVDLPAGRVVEVILARGGFMGMDRDYCAVPPESFQWNADIKALTLNTTREAFKDGPHFKASEWTYAGDPDRVLQVYSQYKIQPYFVAAYSDQGAQNVRERTDNASPIVEQGNNTDIDTTLQIRKAVLGDRDLSADASKVQILTSDGRVTLTGPVASEDEKRVIGEAAAKVVGVANVDNQLEIRAMPNSTNSIVSPILPPPTSY